ncbi:sigma-70 family RNA polymerase sigma factor [Streptomyces sp. NPDC056296]|uniref:sigma-70 family RNA polymerase sigma factor n=1 Tax=Streptomyces sp. NPDC056296 TaxID=3345775 RepID=UPI0035D57D0B
MHESEAQLRTVIAARAGEPRALEELTRDCLPLVYNVVGRAVGGGPDVDDLVQETVIKMLTGLRQLREPDRFRPWLVSIALRQVKDRWRSQSLAPDLVDHEDAQEHLAVHTGFEEEAVLRLRLSGQRRETALAMSWLDPGHRETASLWWLELAGELTREDLAAALAVPATHAAVRVQRMREQLDVTRRVVRAVGARHAQECAPWTELVAAWDGRPSPLMRKRLDRHLRDCPSCAGLVEDQDGLLPAEGLLTGLGLVPLPLGLRDPALPTSLADTAVRSGADGGSVTVPDGSGSTVPDGPGATMPDGSGATVPQPPPGRGLVRLRHLRRGGSVKSLAVAGAGVGTATAVAVAAFALPSAAPEPARAAGDRTPVITPSAEPGPLARPVRSQNVASSTPARRPSRSAASSPRAELGDALPARIMAPPAVTGPLPRIADTAYPVPADAVHVAPSGSDSGDGSAARPYATVRRALSAAPAGGTVVLRSGTYRVAKASITKRLTLQAAPNAQVWIKGSEVVDSWRKRDGRWCTPWEHNLPTPDWEDPKDYLDPEYPLAHRREMVFSDGSALRQVSGLADVGAGTFAVADGSLCVGGDPDGHEMEAAAHPYGLTVWGQEAAGTVVRGIGFAHFGDEGLRIGAPRVTVERVTAVRNGVSGVNLLGAGKPDEIVVRGSNLSFNGRKGMGGGQARGVLLENNLVSYNNTEGFRTAWDAAGVKIMDSTNVTARGNHFLGNYAHALWLDIDIRDATVVRNQFTANHQFGAFFEISRGALFTGNIAANNGTGLAVANASDVELVNNTMSGNVTNLLVKENADREPQPWEKEAGATFVTSNVSVTNNLFVAPSTDTTRKHLMIQRWPCAASPSMLSALDHNGYVNDPAARSVRLGTLQPAGSSCEALEPSSLEELRSLSYEGAGLQVTGEDAAAAVTDPARGDFTLPSKSPVREKGAPLQSRPAGLIDAPAGEPVDLGAVVATAGTAPAADDLPAGAAPRPQGTPSSAAPLAAGPDEGTRPQGGGGGLAATGAQVWPLALTGLACLAGGTLLARRKKRNAAGRHRSA